MLPLILAVLFMFVAIALVMLWLVKSTKKLEQGTQGQNNVSSNNNYSNEILDVKNNWLQFEGFRGSFIDLGNCSYRAIIECPSLNLELLSDVEQSVIEESYARFLNSLTFPITEYVQTREIDKNAMLNNLEQNINESRQMFRGIDNYAEQYFEEMKFIHNYIGNSRVKKKYIIVPISLAELSDLTYLNSSETSEHCISELSNRVDMVISGLYAMGIRAELLSAADVSEVIYSYYHRDSAAIARDLFYEATSFAITSGKQIESRVSFDSIVSDAIRKMEQNVISASISKDEREFYHSLINVLMEYKEHYKSNIKEESVGYEN